MTLRSYMTIVNKFLFVNFVLESGRFTHYWLMINCISPYAFSTLEFIRFLICIRLGYVVYVSVSPPQHTLMGPYMKLGINLSFQSPSIVQYLDLYRGSTYNLYASFEYMSFSKH
jgi:hypothetical protein